MHLRFKRHLRLLHDGERVRVVRDLAYDQQLPGGEAFDMLLDVLGPAPEEEPALLELAQRMQVEVALVRTMLDKLLEIHLIERFDPFVDRFARFDRQLLLFDALQTSPGHDTQLERQQRLHDAHVLVLGLGGIGHQVALSLAAAGVGHLILVDSDVVEEGNLHRQILFSATDIGRVKVEAARDGILRVAPECDVQVKELTVGGPADWHYLIAAFPQVCHVMLSADSPVQLVNWISDARKEFNYHFNKCGYMSTQGLIGPLLGPDTVGYEDLFESWGPLIDEQPSSIRAFNAQQAAPTMAASNAIMANMAALDLIKHIAGIGPIATFEQRLLLDLRTYCVQPG
ncbi:MAG: ThiF family adenylyltransferase [Flavobacteriales bacterium]|nr:ThiF family adenylyltransferase [Flavobacteriales bacterium]